jgi:hypothetical protein
VLFWFNCLPGWKAGGHVESFVVDLRERVLAAPRIARLPSGFAARNKRGIDLYRVQLVH